MKKRLERIVTMGLGLVIVAMLAVSATAEDVPRITKDELKAQLGDPDLIILDVQTQSDWKASVRKIKGAIRENPSEFASWADKYAKEKTLVLYCA